MNYIQPRYLMLMIYENVNIFHIKLLFIEFRNAFDRFDENGDGTISKAELNVIMHSLGHNPTDNELYELLTEKGSEGEYCNILILLENDKPDTFILL